MTEQITHDEISTKRRMPDNLRRFLLKVQGGKMYLPAAFRLVWFRDECPDWGVETMIVEGGEEAGFCTVAAKIVNAEGRTLATAHKTETRKDFPAGHVEKAETGAIARALAVAGFGTQFSKELEEEGAFADAPVGNAHQPNPTPAAQTPPLTPDLTWPGPGQCPACHAPEGKRHGKPCIP